MRLQFFPKLLLFLLLTISPVLERRVCLALNKLFGLLDDPIDYFLVAFLRFLEFRYAILWVLLELVENVSESGETWLWSGHLIKVVLQNLVILAPAQQVVEQQKIEWV